MQISLKEWIIIHVCYRQIFKSPVNLHDLKNWLSINGEDEAFFEKLIEELEVQEVISKNDDFITGINNSDSIAFQQQKQAISTEYLNKGISSFSKIRKLPFISFIGISGSIAASNPILDSDETDLDVYMVCKNNTIWYMAFIERLYTNILNLRGKKLFYCFNYVTEDDFLEIQNKSFYTATELNNLHPLIEKNTSKYDIISQNLWVLKYYPGMQPNQSNRNIKEPRKYSSVLSKMFFYGFYLFKSIKNKKWQKAPSSFNPSVRFNFQRISTPAGGFENTLEKKFDSLLKNQFSSYYRREIVSFLFPNSKINASMNQEKVIESCENLFARYEN